MECLSVESSSSELNDISPIVTLCETSLQTAPGLTVTVELGTVGGGGWREFQPLPGTDGSGDKQDGDARRHVGVHMTTRKVTASGVTWRTPSMTSPRRFALARCLLPQTTTRSSRRKTASKS